MSIRQKILSAIARDPRTVSEISEETGIDRKRVSDNMTAIVKELLATRANDGGAVMYTITDKGRGRIGNPGARDEVRKFVRTPAATKPAEAKPPIEYTQASAQTVQELANALDKITEQKREIHNANNTIAALRMELHNLKQSPGVTVMNNGVMVASLQALMTQGISLVISEKNCFLEDRENQEYRLEPHEFDQVMNALALVQERLAA